MFQALSEHLQSLPSKLFPLHQVINTILPCIFLPPTSILYIPTLSHLINLKINLRHFHFIVLMDWIQSNLICYSLRSSGLIAIISHTKRTHLETLARDKQIRRDTKAGVIVSLPTVQQNPLLRTLLSLRLSVGIARNSERTGRESGSDLPAACSGKQTAALVGGF